MRVNSVVDLVTSFPNRYSSRRLSACLLGKTIRQTPIPGGVGERLKPPVLKIGDRFFREFKEDRGLAITPCFFWLLLFFTLHNIFYELLQSRLFCGQIDTQIDTW